MTSSFIEWGTVPKQGAFPQCPGGADTAAGLVTAPRSSKEEGTDRAADILRLASWVAVHGTLHSQFVLGSALPSFEILKSREGYEPPRGPWPAAALGR